MNRLERVRRMREAGLTYEQVGHIEGITKQRVHEILNPPPRRQKVMLTSGEAAYILGIHPNTLRRWANSGKVKSYRIGNRRDRRFRKVDIQDILEQGNG